jgi:sugar/nucleoside kinase (ribokinase family)
MHDVYAYGMISPSTVHVLRDDFGFPAPNKYAEIASTHASIGGEAANSAIVLAKLGLDVKLDGNWIHPDKSDQLMRLLGAFGIDRSRLTVRADGGTDEIVIADRTTRTVFGNYAAFHAGPVQWNGPSAEDIEQARIVCIDPYFRDQSRNAARLCVEHGRPYVTLDCRHDDYLARHAASAVISHELWDAAYPGCDLRELFDEYQRTCPGLIIFTFGGDELWYARGTSDRRTLSPYPIDPVDTTGAGDAFRGAIAYGLLNAWDDEQTVDFAAAVSACVCLTLPHTLNAPGLEVIQAFRDQHRTPGGDG